MRTGFFKLYLVVLAISFFSIKAKADLWHPDPPPPPPNGAPYFDMVSNITVFEGDIANVLANAIDPEGDPLTFSASNLPAGATLDSATGAITWPTSCHTLGSYTIDLSATDGINAPATTSVTIVVVSISDVEYYVKMIPIVKSEIDSLSETNRAIGKWSKQLSDAAYYFTRSKTKGLKTIQELCTGTWSVNSYGTTESIGKVCCGQEVKAVSDDRAEDAQAADQDSAGSVTPSLD